MKITCFTSQSDLDGKFVTLFEEQGFVPLVDGLHRQDLVWLTAKFKDTPHLFGWLDYNNMLHFVDVQELQNFPSFVVYFNTDEIISDFEWEQVQHYFRHLVNGTPVSDRTLRCIKKLKDQVAKPQVILQSEQPALPQYYEFNSKILEDQDIGIFEITKANGTTPYTTVIRNFSIKGYKPLFTNYFACNAFRNDFVAIQFLMKLWEEFMQGPMDVDGMLKDATEACYPGEDYIPITEPEVYQKSLQEIVERFQ